VNLGYTASIPFVREVVPTSRNAPQPWRHTGKEPAEGWFRADFDDVAWSDAPGGFGSKGTPGAVIGTEWRSPDIWLRRVFTLPGNGTSKLLLLMHHDEDAEVYLKGIFTAKVSGYGTEYEERAISEQARAALRPGGKNIMAVHCHQTRGGQYIDVGLGTLENSHR
jgi:hypothetical protein